MPNRKQALRPWHAERNEAVFATLGTSPSGLTVWRFGGNWQRGNKGSAANGVAGHIHVRPVVFGFRERCCRWLSKR